MSIKQKMLVLLTGALAALLLVLGVQTYTFHKSLMDGRRALVQSQVETALSPREDVPRRGGGRPVDRAKKPRRWHATSCGPCVSTATTTSSCSTPAASNQGFVVAHPSPEVEGKNLWAAKDANGTEFVVGQIENARRGGGYTSFLFPRLGESVAGPQDQLHDGFRALGTGPSAPRSTWMMSTPPSMRT